MGKLRFSRDGKKYNLTITSNSQQAYIHNVAAEHFDIKVIDSAGVCRAEQDVVLLFEEMYKSKWLMMEGSRVNDTDRFCCSGGLVVPIVNDNNKDSGKRGLLAITTKGNLQDKMGMYDSFGRNVIILPFVKSTYGIETFFFRDGGLWLQCCNRDFMVANDITWGQNNKASSATGIDFNLSVSKMVVVNRYQSVVLDVCWKYIKDQQPKVKSVKGKVVRQYDKEEVEAIEQLTQQARIGGCVECGVKEIQFHHKDPKSKVFEIGEWKKLGKSVDEVREELAKCECRCPSCHTKQHLAIKDRVQRKDLD